MFIGDWGKKKEERRRRRRRRRREGKEGRGVRRAGGRGEGEDLNNICPTHGIR